MAALAPAGAVPVRHARREELVAGLSHVLRVEPQRIALETLADRVWEREWLRDFHPDVLRAAPVGRAASRARAHRRAP